MEKGCIDQEALAGKVEKTACRQDPRPVGRLEFLHTVFEKRPRRVFQKLEITEEHGQCVALAVLSNERLEEPF